MLVFLLQLRSWIWSHKKHFTVHMLDTTQYKVLVLIVSRAFVHYFSSMLSCYSYVHMYYGDGTSYLHAGGKVNGAAFSKMKSCHIKELGISYSSRIIIEDLLKVYNIHDVVV